MKLNIAIDSSKIDIARTPELGKDSEAYFSPEVCVERGVLVATGAATADYTSSGGTDIPVAGRDLVARISSPNAAGVGGAMKITLSVTLEGSITDTAVATFDIPTYTDAVNLNLFPMGICADFIPATPANVLKKITAINATPVAVVSNMSAGNKFQILSVPDKDSFAFISCTDGTDGKFNLPKVVEIACGANASAFTRLGRTESNMLSVKFKDRGALEQLNRFNGSRGTMRVDVVKDGLVLAAHYLYSGYYVMASTERGSGDDEVIATSEGPYENFIIGYPRVSA